MKAFLLSLLLFAGLGTDPKTANPNWGIGVLMPEDAASVNQATTFPTTPIPYTTTPGGKPVGSVWAEDAGGYLQAVYGTKANKQEIDPMGLREVEYEARVLQVYAVSNGYFALRGYADGEFIWVPEMELSKQGYRFVPWANFLQNRKESFYALPEQGLNLREGAGTSFKVLVKLVESQYLIKFTGEAQDMWMEVEAEYWPVHPCAGGESAAKKYKGWIKALDDKGFPNVWYDTRGC